MPFTEFLTNCPRSFADTALHLGINWLTTGHVVEDNAADHGSMLTGQAVASQLVKVTGFDHLVLAVGDVGVDAVGGRFR